MTEKDHPPSPTGSDDGTEKSVAFKVPTPTFGGVKQTDAKTISPWTGGKPNNTMTGLEEPSPKSINSKQYRPTHVGSQTKSQEARVEGLTNKFFKGKDLLVFQRKVWEHLVENELNTITYLYDSADMIFVPFCLL